MQRIKSTPFTSKLLYRFDFLDWVLDWGIQTCSGRGIQVSKWSEVKKNSTSWKFRTVKALTQGTEIENSPTENLSKTNCFSSTLIEKVKPVFLVEYEFEYREKIELQCFLWKFRTITILMRERKQWCFSWLLAYKWCVFDWDSDRANLTGGGSELEVWISSEIKINSTFWNIWTVTNPMHGSQQKVSYLNRPPQAKSVRWRLWLEES